jgi:hypothetical protein
MGMRYVSCEVRIELLRIILRDSDKKKICVRNKHKSYKIMRVNMFAV